MIGSNQSVIGSSQCDMIGSSQCDMIGSSQCDMIGSSAVSVSTLFFLLPTSSVLTQY